MKLEIFQQALSPMPYARFGDQVILLTAIHRLIKIDNEVEIWLASGATFRLTADEACQLEDQLTKGIARAIQEQASQIEIPRLVRKPH